SGNAGRNTTIIRSNYLLPGNEPFYEWSMKLWEGLEQDFNYNAMVSQRGVLNLYHSDAQRDAYARRGNAMRLHGVDAELLDRVGAMAGLRLPIESHVLQAFVSEGIKPAIDCVVTFGAGHFYVSQSDKGGLVFGGDIDGYNSYAWRGNLPTVADVMEEGMAIWP